MKRAWLAVLVVVVAGCGNNTRTVPSDAIAIVGTQPVSRADFRAELARAQRAYAARGQEFPKPGTDEYRRVRESAVALLVDRARLELEARRAHVAVTQTEIDARLREFKRRTFGADERRFRDQLRRTGLTVEDVRAAIRAELLGAKLRDVETTDPEVTYAPGFKPASSG